MDAEDCPVCLMTFDDTVQRPSTLPCGHTFCMPCLNEITKQDKLTCPTCRVEHVVPESGQFPVSYTIEALIRRQRTAASAFENFMKNVRESSQNRSGTISMAIHSMLQEQEGKVLVAMRNCVAVHEQLDRYRASLVEWGERQQILEDQLQALVDQSKDARLLAQEEESKVKAKMEQVQQGDQQLQALLQTLREVTTEHEAGIVSVDVACCIDKERQRVEECQTMFPDVHTVTTIMKVRDASSAAVEGVASVQAAQEIARDSTDASGDPSLHSAQVSSIGFENLLTPNWTVREASSAAEEATMTDPATQAIAGASAPDISIIEGIENLLTPTLTAEDLRILSEETRSLLQDGRVFAVHQEAGHGRISWISLENDHLYLHPLQHQLLPPNAFTVQMDQVVPASPPCLVFLDLAWGGNAPRRILIRLEPDNPRGRQFLLMCTGERGPCYANTKLWKVLDKFGPWECVCGGDYEHNNGTGGAALLPDLTEGEYLRTCRAGAVWWCWGDDPGRGTMFAISTKQRRSGVTVPSAFGEVVSGIEVVLAAAQQDPITNVSVVDCGVVLWN